MSIEILEAAKDAAKSDLDFLLAARDRVEAEISNLRARYHDLRSKAVAAIIDGSKELPSTAAIRDQFSLLTDALTKLNDYDIPDADLAAELADLNLQKFVADEQESKANEQLEAMRSGVPADAVLDVSNTSANRARVAANRSQQQIGEALGRLATRRAEVNARKHALSLEGYLQLR
jgi:hypothetical protein